MIDEIKVGKESIAANESWVTIIIEFLLGKDCLSKMLCKMPEKDLQYTRPEDNKQSTYY